FAPAERLDGHAQIFLEADRVHDVPAIHAETLLTAIDPVRLDDLWQAKKGGGVGAILAVRLLKVPGSAEIVFGTGSANRWEVGIAIKVEFDLALAPPASAV